MRTITKSMAILIIICFTGSLIIPTATATSGPFYEVPSINNGNVVFKAIDLPSNYNFSVDINKKTYFSSYNILNISLPLGSYNYTIILPFQYLANKTSGTLQVTKGTTEIDFKVMPKGSDTYQLLAISILISVLSILIFLLAYIKYVRTNK